jgi:hypothetical protein
VGESSARQIDPRFDPRFQRGFVPDAAAPMEAGMDAADRRAEPASRTSAPASRFGDARDTPPESSVTPGGAARSTNREAGRREGERQAPHAATEEPAHTDTQAEPAAEGDQPIEDDGSDSRWFWIAIGACLAFVVVGSILYWVQASDPWLYTGSSRSRIDETISLVVTALSPAFVQAGVLGTVAVLVIWAARGARRGGGRR